MTVKPEIDRDKCDGCGLCITVCRCNGLILIDNKVTVIETVECEWCTVCELVCPTGAIRCPYEIVFAED